MKVKLGAPDSHSQASFCWTTNLADFSIMYKLYNVCAYCDMNFRTFFSVEFRWCKGKLQTSIIFRLPYDENRVTFDNFLCVQKINIFSILNRVRYILYFGICLVAYNPAYTSISL